MARRLILATLLILGAAAQPPSRVVGTVVGINADALSVKSDAGDTVSIPAAQIAKVQRVMPGERDLSKAESITLADVAAGDRVLVRPGSLIVMTARAIEQRHASERQMWQQRGLLGAVDRVEGNEIRITARSQPVTVIANEKTSIRRYAPDSIRFADAVPAKIADIRKGDQLRVLGENSADGSRITAEQVVFGTFRTLAATISAVTDSHLTVKNLENGRTLTIVTKPDSQLKKLPVGRPMFAPEMLDRLPAAKLDELKAGDTIIVSSTAGAKPNELTAIVLLANAEPLIAMLSRRQGPDPLSGGTQAPSLESMISMPVQ